MESKKNIYKAISEFQNEVPVIHKNSEGYGYSYANLNSIFEIIKPLLQKHGLGFTQLLDNESLKTIVFHIESGETLESSVHIQQNVTLAKMNTFQVLGSAITYYRRYSLSAILGLITDKDVDACGVEKDTVNQEKPFLNDKHENWSKCIEYLKKEGSKIDDLTAKYRITKTVREQLENTKNK